jgi:hypothetical protein
MSKRGALILSFLVVAIALIASKSVDYVKKEPNRIHSAATAHKLDNPMSVTYLKENLRPNSPRLILTAEAKHELEKKIKQRPEVANYYAAIKRNAKEILNKPLLQRVKIGRRLLSVSREMLYRMGILSIVYSLENDEKILERINAEILAICDFSDWNPSHYLDVAEMSLALALAVDWTGSDLPRETVQLAKENLINKGLKPSFDKKGNTGWINGSNNWNQVCHGGMIAAAIVIADDEPALASTIIGRALDGMPYALEEYGPDGVYPEGATYWEYGTSFSAMTSSMFKTAFGVDFGLAAYPSFLESAAFKVLSTAPSGLYYNFADCGDKRSENADIILAWFATQTGNSIYYEKDRFLRTPESMGTLSRVAGPGLVWMSQFEPKLESGLPTAWKGAGANPVVFFRGGENDPRQFYFGAKGGRGMVNHGNMDGGSFILEIDGVRWSVDPGNQSYHELEKTGFDLWGRCQECERWKLLTKNNFGHSTLTVNNALHNTEGLATIDDFSEGDFPTALINMDATFSGQLRSAKRKFTKDGPASLLIEDFVEINDSTNLVTWQMMTTADVRITKLGATLTQDGKELKLQNISHPNISVSIISLDPPPFELDRKIKNLKRIEIRIPAYLFDKNDINRIAVRLE